MSSAVIVCLMETYSRYKQMQRKLMTKQTEVIDYDRGDCDGGVVVSERRRRQTCSDPNDVNFHSYILFIGDVDGEDDGAVRVKSDDNGF